MSSFAMTKLFNRVRGEKALRRLDTLGGMSITLSVDKRDIILDPTGVFPGDVTIGGDLTVNGTTTTVNSTVTTIDDNIITLNDGETAAGVATLGTTSGLEIDRGSLPNVFWLWDETAKQWTAGGEWLGGVLDPTLGMHVGDRDFNDARYLLEANNLSELVNIVTARSNLGVAIGVDVVAFAHVGASGAAHADVVADGASGFMTGVDKTKLDGISAGADVTSVFGRDGDVIAVAGDYTASEITNVAAGTIAATDVQAALNELDTEKLANVVEDLTPQLGGNLDTNLKNLQADGNVILSFTTGGESATNWIDIKHAATGLGPVVRAVGTDTNVDLELSSKGTGVVNITGAVTVSSTVDGRDIATDGTKLDGIAAGATVNTVLTGSAALDFASIASLGQADLTIAVASAAVGDEVALGLPAAPTAGLVFNAFVDSAGSVTVRAHNYTAGAIDAASATYNVRVFQ